MILMRKGNGIHRWQGSAVDALHESCENICCHVGVARDNGGMASVLAVVAWCRGSCLYVGVSHESEGGLGVPWWVHRVQGTLVATWPASCGL